MPFTDLQTHGADVAYSMLCARATWSLKLCLGARALMYPEDVAACSLRWVVKWNKFLNPAGPVQPENLLLFNATTGKVFFC